MNIKETINDFYKLINAIVIILENKDINFDEIVDVSIVGLGNLIEVHYIVIDKLEPRNDNQVKYKWVALYTKDIEKILQENNKNG